MILQQTLYDFLNELTIISNSRPDVRGYRIRFQGGQGDVREIEIDDVFKEIVVHTAL